MPNASPEQINKRLVFAAALAGATMTPWMVAAAFAAHDFHDGAVSVVASFAATMTVVSVLAAAFFAMKRTHVSYRDQEQRQVEAISRQAAESHENLMSHLTSMQKSSSAGLAAVVAQLQQVSAKLDRGMDWEAYAAAMIDMQGGQENITTGPVRVAGVVPLSRVNGKN